MSELYPLPLKARFAAVWAVIILLPMGACITAIVYGCTARGDNNANYEFYANEAAMSDALLDIVNAQQRADNGVVWRHCGSDVSSWLLSIAVSLVTSLLLWQPLPVYAVTWLKL